ncbi:MAG TPA: Imm1 family immunity protein [Pseudonocardiaceae bacterium]|nr:Imm1 family immunity protein [Pseudonocardiaceae bacterium]
MALHAQRGSLVLTASLTTGVACVVRGFRESVTLIDKVLTLDHTEWETILLVGDGEFRRTPTGPFPDHQMRVSVKPSAGYAALNYMDNNDRQMAIANSYNPARPPPPISLIFNGRTGATFPPAAAISIAQAREALQQWLRTRERPTCIQWQRYDNC